MLNNFERSEVQNPKKRVKKNSEPTDGSAALQSRKQSKKNFDVVSSKSFIPFGWKRKTGQAANLIESFYHAIHGLGVGLRGQRNLRIHLMAAVAVTVAGFYFRIDTTGWLALVIAMGLVISTELINTALEHLVDIATDGQYRLSARLAKDTAAAAVLVASVVATAIGAIVFGPKVLSLASSWFHI